MFFTFKSTQIPFSPNTPHEGIDPQISACAFLPHKHVQQVSKSGTILGITQIIPKKDNTKP
jgi:hypothetical protein